jgi:integrase
MSKRRRQTYSGCSVEAHRSYLHLRFRVTLADGAVKHVARATGMSDTPENRMALRPLARLVAAAIAAGKRLADVDQIIGRPAPSSVDQVSNRMAPAPSGPTVAEYFTTWIDQQTPIVRRAQARDYRRHLKRNVLPVLGKLPLADLKPADVRALQADLLAQGKSPKYVRNIIAGSFRAMVQQARIDELVTRDVFAGLKWPRWNPPKADPFTIDEVKRILEYLRAKRFGFHPGPGSTSVRFLPHPAFHAFVQLLFWTGLRPSEAAGLQWGDIDLVARRLHVRRSRHLYAYGEPKTASARRTVELFDSSVELLRTIQPLHVAPEMPVLTNTNGKPIEPNAFLRHWYDCLRGLGIRQRGLYATKDTFVTNALSIGARIAWLEAQTGVNYATLRRHYGQWMPSEDRTELQRFAALDPALFDQGSVKLSARSKGRGGQFPKKPRDHYVQPMREGGFEPPRESH